eukprot:CAMPEP_0202858134 /NCGR_PEP_ID=MMETSP1391-20130828/795_1 /ASSEMBLY_ACC=CAM_ASM_000867 /TAXON_ID=1034604 /ORGANISM="Chlamydomonas leiostraca, Strain SAG 11-49" /LENGTH=160 /DNA_ID=CAMNT_0049537019 /DNA_START=47 /DNA_END=529 /DNA_ORIENTATION=+
MSVSIRTSTVQTARVKAAVPTRVVSRPSSRVVLRATETETETVPEFSLQASRAAADGYVEKDTAGQSNMYPTVTRPFEAGSAADSNENAGYNAGVALGAAAVAGGAIALGLLALGVSGQGEAVDANLAPLSSYRTKFASELGLNKLAPAPTPAPAVEADA